MMRYRNHLERYVVAEDGCWNWTGPVAANGYGLTGSIGYAHRFFYVNLVGQIPKGLELDHLCRNRRCVNPDHLEPVTHEENVRRSWVGRHPSACPRGHAYTPDNLLKGTTGRKCKTCLRERARARRAAQKAVAL